MFGVRSRVLVLACIAWAMASVSTAKAGLLNPGDLAFSGFNADGDDDFAIVLLADAGAGTLVRFNDNEWQGSAFNSGEGAVTWNVTESLAAGTVVTFTNVDNTANSGFGPSRGTLSGAPKYKAMQIIDENENDARGFYGGAIGYFGLNGDCNHAIMIRTFLSKNNVLVSQAGAGIVAASKPESELQEVNNKLGALKSAIQMAQTIQD